MSNKHNKIKPNKELQAVINISNRNPQAKKCAILAELNARKASNGDKPLAKAI